MKPHVRVQSGFSAVELMVTIALLGILLALAAPSLRQLTLNQGVKSAAFDLFSALQYARSEAIKRPGETVILKAGAASDGAWSTGWRIVDGSNRSLRSWTVASTITVADTNTTPLTQVTFSKDGHLATTTAPKLEARSTATVAGVTARCVKVDLMGRPIALNAGCS